MIDKTAARAIENYLFGEAGPDGNVYAILDGASIGRDLIVNLHERRVDFHCLLPGNLAPDMAEVAPYLAELKPRAEFTQWVVGEGWGQHWGVFVASPAGDIQMRGHFRSLVDVYDPDGKPLIFRYYDPRVLRVFLPTCAPGELAEVFGPAEAFFVEADDGEALLRFSVRDAKLVQQRVELSKLEPAGP